MKLLPQHGPADCLNNEAVRGTKREKKQCPHCGKDVAVNGYARWHGNNCKEL